MTPATKQGLFFWGKPRKQTHGDNRMGIFGKLLGNKAKDAVQKFSGNTDFLEALCAGCALTAAAEGGIDDAEYDQTLKVIQSNSAISAGFSPRDIEACFSRLAPKTSSRMGKAELKREIEEAVKRDQSMGEAIVLACLDVADTGGISPPEEEVMKIIAGLCQVNYEKLKAG
jgi:tellurite resistance protein TerB